MLTGPISDTFPQAVAVALGVVERPAEPLAEALRTALRHGRRLLVVRGCGHRSAEVAEVAGELLGACPELTVLAESPVPLGINGEYAVTIPGRWAPVDPATLTEADHDVLTAVSVLCRVFDTAMAAEFTGVPTATAEAALTRLAERRVLLRERNGWWVPPETRTRWAVNGSEAKRAAAVERRAEWAAKEADELRAAVETGTAWRDRFDLVADDLRATVLARTRPDARHHHIARVLAELLYARQFLAEARATFESAAALAVDDRAAARDLRSAADVAMTEHRGEPAFALLKRAGRGGDRAGRAVALAYAVCVGNRFPATFTEPVPHEELCELLAEAEQAAPPDDPIAGAYLAAARAWNATGEKTTPDPDLTVVALAAARATGQPVLISAALDAVASADGAAGRFARAHDSCGERLSLFERLPRHEPQIGVEIVDTLHVVPLAALAAGRLPDAVRAAELSWEDPFRGLYMRAGKFVVPLALTGDFDKALEYAETTWDAWQRVGRPPARWLAPAAHAAGLVHGLRGQAAQYDEWAGRALGLSTPGVHSGLAESFTAFAVPRLALHRGDIDTARSAVVRPAAPWEETPHQVYDAYAWAIAAETAVMAGDPEAESLLRAAEPAARENSWAAACLTRARARLHRDPAALAQALAGWQAIGARFEHACTLLLVPERRDEGAAALAALGCRVPVDSL
ncbi:hypothetical protein [Amycolatopsis magusensis]|uniref:hypothetical protein n=1 Tax=Amycolatopsis magusensis TaxID=882444 RepID=UPI0024A7E2BE|nr:hypothetical protein [Amycolatopsis magusensis]MDI5978139.1 hypothetical protein [Amycolatopsis magusensis]